MIKSSYRFRVIRWIDFLTFGVAALLAAAATIWAVLTPGNTLPGIVITGAVALGFMLIYAMILCRRLVFSRKVAYTTVHGVLVLEPTFGSIRVFLEKEFERVLKLWEEAIWQEVEAGKAKAGDVRIVRKSMEGLILQWVKEPFALSFRPGFKWMGLTSGSGQLVRVVYKEPMEASALGHEIGHVILILWRDDGSEETLKAFHDRYDVPC